MTSSSGCRPPAAGREPAPSSPEEAEQTVAAIRALGCRSEATEANLAEPPACERAWGGEEEIVKAVMLLVETDFITGETIRVDGGRHVR